MTEEKQEEGPLWSDHKIVEEAKKGPEPTKYHEVVTRAYAIGLCIDVRDEYEAQANDLRRQLAECQQRLAEAIPLAAIKQLVWLAATDKDAAKYYSDELSMVYEWLDRRTAAPTAHTEEDGAQGDTE